MRIPPRWFTNEKNNRICIHLTDRGNEGVKILIQGPRSSMTNEITRMEAEILYEELGKALAQETRDWSKDS